MIEEDTVFTLRLAQDARDLRAAQRLRYCVFVEELGADGPMVDHAARLERDRFDDIFDHLLLIDTRRDPAGLEDVVGVYRLLPSDRLGPGGRFYSEDEYDLTALRDSGRKLLELGRSCVHPDHRGGTAMFHLWNALADYVLERGIEILFGVASFHGTDIAGADAVAGLSAPSPSRAPWIAGPGTGAGVSADGPAAARGAGPQGCDGGDACADQGLSAAGRVRGRRGLHRQGVQHHRCLSGDGHGADVGTAPRLLHAGARVSEPAEDWKAGQMAVQPITVAGWLRIVWRGGLLVAVTYGCLLLLLLLRLVERPLFGVQRPWTPYITQFVCRMAFVILRLPLVVRGQVMRQRGAVVANHASWLDIFRAERGAAGVFRRQIRGGALGRYWLACAGDRDGVHRPQGA